MSDTLEFKLRPINQDIEKAGEKGFELILAPFCE